MELTKESARELRERDFIPGGERVDIRTLSFRRTKETEVYRCCVQTGDDPQSGPFYCGDIAEFVAIVRGDHQAFRGVVALCDRASHRPSPELIGNR